MPFEFLDEAQEIETHSRARGSCNMSTSPSRGVTIEGSEHNTIMLSNGITLHLEDALLSSRSNRNLLSFQYVCRNGYHLETLNANKNDFLCITSYKNGIKTILEKFDANNSGLYCVQIKVIESYATMSQRLAKPNEFGL